MTAYNHSSGYTYGTDAVPTSPLTLKDLRQIEAAAHVQPGDAELHFYLIQLRFQFFKAEFLSQSVI